MVSRWCPVDAYSRSLLPTAYFEDLKSIKINCLLPGTHLYVIYDIYVTFPTTPIEIIKMCSIVSFNKLYNEYLGLRYNIPKRQLTDYFKTCKQLVFIIKTLRIISC